MADIEFAPETTFGERVRSLRTRLGMSRPTLGQLCERSADWVKDIETGRAGTPRPGLLLRLAKALKIRDMATLVAEMNVPIDAMVRPTHESLPAIHRALTSYTIATPTLGTLPVDVLRGRTDSAWRAWHRSPNQRSEVGALLPSLIVDTHAAVRTLRDADRRAALVVQADVFHLAQQYLAHMSAPELSWLTMDQGMRAAQDADDPLAIAGAAWCAANQYRAAAREDEAVSIALDAARMLEPHLEAQDGDWLGMYGALHLSASMTEARIGQHGDALAHWDRADRVARKLGKGYMHPWTAFGAGNVAVGSVSIEVETGRVGEALRRGTNLAESMDSVSLPSAGRRSRFHIELARGMFRKNDAPGALYMLQRAETESPEEVKYTPPVRTMVREMASARRSLVRDDARVMAERLGVVA